jgi:UDP-GlcNAc:undecaprenyl-phosphate GlcNAc-1-phosphate transferase
MARQPLTSRSRFGGLIFGVLTLVLVALHPSLVASTVWWGVLVGGVLCLLLGSLDDSLTLPWWAQAVFQVVLGGVAVFYGASFGVSNLPWVGVVPLSTLGLWVPALLYLLWWLTLANALNWIDGMDHLAPLVLSITFITLALFSLQVSVLQPTITIIIGIATACLVVFTVFFNHPPYNLTLGTAGLWLYSYLLAYLSLAVGAKVAIVVLPLLLPLLDALLVVALRTYHRRAPWRGGDRRHLHQILVDTGWSSAQVLLLYGGHASVLSALTLYQGTAGKWLGLVVLGTLTLVLLLWLRSATPTAHTGGDMAH